MKVIHTISSLLSEVDKKTLVVFDIDYTLFRARNNLGSPEWIHHLIDLEVEAGRGLEESFKKWYPAWLKAQRIAEIELMDEAIPDLLKTLEQSSAGSLALTARGPTSAPVTHEQLAKLGLQFDTMPISQLNFSLEFKNPVLLEKGILFVHEFNEKGTVFLEWFKKAQSILKEQMDVKKVIFIDDTERHVISMGEATRQLGLEYRGYHYIKADTYKAAFKATFNSKIVLNQANILEQNLAEDEIKALLSVEAG